MKRIIYCPDNQSLEIATVLAGRICLPINIGDSEMTSNLLFDRTKVQIVSVPEYNYVEYKKDASFGFHHSIVYVNDSIMFTKDIRLVIDNEQYKTIYIEKNKIKFSILENKYGLRSCTIENNKNVLDRFFYEVS